LAATTKDELNMSNQYYLKIPWLFLTLLAMLLASACSGHGKPEEYSLMVTMGKTTPSELVKAFGPPIERTANQLDRPIERLHFNVPYYRTIHLRVVDQNGQKTDREVRGKNVISFYFVDGRLSSVD
jgi:hypothetical protein